MKTDHYTVVPGKLLAGEYPGALDEEEAREKLRGLLQLGVDFFLDLTEATERLQPYQKILEGEAARLDLSVEYRRMAIRDLGIPTVSLMRDIQQTIAQSIDAGRTVYVHCWGGVGRTGTVVGCYLVETGLGCEDALEEMRRLRAGTRNSTRVSPDTVAQKEMILGWNRESVSVEE